MGVLQDVSFFKKEYYDDGNKNSIGFSLSSIAQAARHFLLSVPGSKLSMRFELGNFSN